MPATSADNSIFATGRPVRIPHPPMAYPARQIITRISGSLHQLPLWLLPLVRYAAHPHSPSPPVTPRSAPPQLIFRQPVVRQCRRYVTKSGRRRRHSRLGPATAVGREGAGAGTAVNGFGSPAIGDCAKRHRVSLFEISAMHRRGMHRAVYSSEVVGIATMRFSID